MEGAFLPKPCIRVIILCHLVFTLPTCGLPFLGIQHDLKLDSFRHFLAFYWNHNCSTHWYSNTSHLGWAYPLRL